MATKKSNKTKSRSATIAKNKKARHDYFIEEDFEAGLVLEGWEVKSLREGRVQLKESYVIVRHGELWLFGCHMSPLTSASSHKSMDPTRTRKLLLKHREISQLIGSVERKGYTVVPLDLYWSKGRAKLSIGLAKGKKQHDKRASLKEKDWERESRRLIKDVNTRG